MTDYIIHMTDYIIHMTDYIIHMTDYIIHMTQYEKGLLTTLLTYWAQASLSQHEKRASCQQQPSSWPRP